MMAPKQIFVTGGTGFVGSYLLRYLVRQGCLVKAMKRANSPMDLVADVKEQIEWLEGDILDMPFLEAALKGVHQVYHAAAMISFDPKEAILMHQINVEGTANLVNACLHEGVEKIVHISSIAALGRKEFEPNINESAQWENSSENSNYAISKFKAECEVWRAFQEGLPMAILNPSVILGAGYWNEGSCKLFSKVAQGFSYYPAGNTGFVDVRDVARAAILLMESNISGERFIVNGDNWSYQQFFGEIAQSLGKKLPTKKVKPIVVNILWRLEWLRSKLLRTAPLLTKETARTAQASYYYQNKKIIDKLAINFVPIEQCVQETAAALTKSQKEHKNYAILDLI